MSKPDSDAIYAATDAEMRREGRDPESRERAALNHHYTGNFDAPGVKPTPVVRERTASLPWLQSIDPIYLTAGDAELRVRNPRAAYAIIAFAASQIAGASSTSSMSMWRPLAATLTGSISGCSIQRQPAPRTIRC